LLGSGNDFLFADNVRVRGVATIDAGSGDDEVVLVNSDVDKVLTAVMGSGRDRLSIFASSADLAVLIGGSDFDTLNVDDEDFADDAVVVLFEDVNVIV
jgi:Ca2+-binding RTX toxin-like protein